LIVTAEKALNIVVWLNVEEVTAPTGKANAKHEAQAHPNTLLPILPGFLAEQRNDVSDGHSERSEGNGREEQQHHRCHGTCPEIGSSEHEHCEIFP
jgi:hypothetical protein